MYLKMFNSGFQVGDALGIRRCSDGTLHLYINGEDLGVAASNIPKVRTVCVSVCGDQEVFRRNSSSLHQRGGSGGGS